MPSKSFRYASIALRVLEKILGSNFSVSGLEKIPNHPVMFVANHFTRAETFFVPYLIHKYTGRQIRCLADSGLYFGALGKFLESVGTISTKNPNRDKIIIKDLITGDHDWMIYPEGSMVKSKETRNEKGYVNYTPYRTGPVRTGSAVLALKSQLYRMDMIDAAEKKQTAEVLKYFEDEYGIEYQDYFAEINTKIIPLNITYYPLRPGTNKIKNLITRLVPKIPKQIAEELEIEGNLLLGAEINLSFGDPICLGKYISANRAMIYQIPIIKNETKTNLILRYFRSKLTNDFMERIYSDTQINFDHIFSASIAFFPKQEIDINHLKRIIYLSGVMIKKCGKYRLNSSIYEENLFRIFLDEPNEAFDSVFELAKNQGVIEVLSGDKIKIRKNIFAKKYDFHEIRRENSLQVIANEFSLLETASNIVRRNVKIPDDEIRRKVFTEIHNYDLEIFNSDYEIYFDKKFSKPKEIGSPFFLDAKSKDFLKVKKVGILVSHGYKSAPAEVLALGKYFNSLGFKVYGSRLKGHGTSPSNLKDVTWEDWYYGMQRGYAALHNICSKIVIIGFSTGGLLSLLSCANKSKNHKKLAGIVVINSALKLLDLRTRMVPGINLWNEMMEKLNFDKAKFEFVDDEPENPHINYSRNYLKGVEQLEKLMHKTGENLRKIYDPTMVIQSKKDPVVNPISGRLIYEKISSKEKILSEPDFSNHVIVNGEKKEEIFAIIRGFFAKLKFL
jgi:esterase/lipase/1-acyl-sn-glycerol-3-phosphate acyltransferase